MDPNLFWLHISKLQPETTGSTPKIPKLVRNRSGTDKGIIQNILNDIYASKDLIFNNILREKDNPQKIKALHISKTIRFPDRKTQKIIKKIILQIQ